MTTDSYGYQVRPQGRERVPLGQSSLPILARHRTDLSVVNVVMMECSSGYPRNCFESP